MEHATYSLQLVVQAETALRKAGIGSHEHREDAQVDASFAMRLVNSRVGDIDARLRLQNVRACADRRAGCWRDWRELALDDLLEILAEHQRSVRLQPEESLELNHGVLRVPALQKSVGFEAPQFDTHHVALARRARSSS